MTIRAISYGGGVQSTALLVLAAQRRIDFRRFMFANVGDDSEHPATIAYVHDVARRYAYAHGIALDVLTRTRRDGSTETLLGRLTKPGSRSVAIPLRAVNGAPGNRSCTADFKIRVITKHLRTLGATKADPAVVGIGISLDEIHRIGGRKPIPIETVVYPLVGVGEGLHMTRLDCERVIRDAGLPVPPKSACWFCPFHRPARWEDMARDEPELFAAACALEDQMNQIRDDLGKPHIFMTRFARPLREAITGDQLTLFSEDDPAAGSCDSGYCFT